MPLVDVGYSGGSLLFLEATWEVEGTSAGPSIKKSIALRGREYIRMSVAPRLRVSRNHDQDADPVNQGGAVPPAGMTAAMAISPAIGAAAVAPGIVPGPSLGIAPSAKAPPTA